MLIDFSRPAFDGPDDDGPGRDDRQRGARGCGCSPCVELEPRLGRRLLTLANTIGPSLVAVATALVSDAIPPVFVLVAVMASAPHWPTPPMFLAALTGAHPRTGVGCSTHCSRHLRAAPMRQAWGVNRVVTGLVIAIDLIVFLMLLNVAEAVVVIAREILTTSIPQAVAVTWLTITCWSWVDQMQDRGLVLALANLLVDDESPNKVSA